MGLLCWRSIFVVIVSNCLLKASSASSWGWAIVLLSGDITPLERVRSEILGEEGGIDAGAGVCSIVTSRKEKERRYRYLGSKAPVVHLVNYPRSNGQEHGFLFAKLAVRGLLPL